MANYCSNCGASVSGADSYCPSCGAALNGAYANTNVNTSSGTNTASTVLGTLVAVTLLGGVTRNLYYYGGRYFLDPYCRRPFAGQIMGPHRVVRAPMGGMIGGGPRGGGPHGPMGHGGGHGGPGGHH